VIFVTARQPDGERPASGSVRPASGSVSTRASLARAAAVILTLTVLLVGLSGVTTAGLATGTLAGTSPDLACVGSSGGAAYVTNSGLTVYENDGSILYGTFPDHNTVDFGSGAVSLSASGSAQARVDEGTGDRTCLGGVTATNPITVDPDGESPFVLESDVSKFSYTDPTYSPTDTSADIAYDAASSLTVTFESTGLSQGTTVIAEDADTDSQLATGTVDSNGAVTLTLSSGTHDVNLYVDDTQSPSLTSPTKVDTTTVQVTLADDVNLDESTVAASDFSLSTGSISSISVAESGSDATVTINLASAVDTDAIDVSLTGSVADTSGNTLSSGTVQVSGMDGVGPTFDSVSGVDDTTVQVTLADGVDVDETTIAASDFSLSTGSISSISTAESGTDATVTINLAAAVDTDSLDVTLTGSVADASGNTLTTGTKSVSGMDGVAPTLASASRTDATTISVTVTDGVNVDESTISAGDFSLSTGTIDSISVTESGTDATVTINLASAVDADSVDVSLSGSLTDTSGNSQASGTVTASGMDGVAPTFSSVSRVDDTTVQVTLADGVDVDESSIAASDFSLSSGSISSISVAESGTDATVTINLASAVDTDSLDISISGSIADTTGNTLTSGTKTVSGMDGVGPTFSSVSRVDETTVQVTLADGVDVDETTIAASDFSLSAGSISSISVAESGTDATVTINLASAVDTDSLDVSISGSIADGDGNTLTSGTKTVSGMDGVAPTFSSVSRVDDTTVQVTLADGEDVDESSVAASDFSLSSGSISSVSVAESGTDATVTINLATAVDTDSLDVSIVSDITDTSGNTLSSGTATVSSMDGVAPTITDGTRVDDTTVQITLADGVDVDETTVAASDFSLSTGSISSISVAESGTNATVTINLASAVDADVLDVSISGSVADGDGNAATSGTTSVSGMDGVGPSFSSVSRVDDTTVQVTLADGVDVDESTISAGDFSLSSGSISSISVAESGTDATVTINLASAVDTDSLDVSIVGSIADTSGNTLTSGTKSATGMDGVAPTISSASRVDSTTIQVTLADGVDVDESTISAGDFSLSSGSISSISVAESGTDATVTINLAAAVDADTVDVSVSGSIADTNGNALTTGTASVSGMDGVAPTITNGTHVDDTTLRVTLAEGVDVDESTISAGDFSLSSGSISSISVSESGTNATVTISLATAVDADSVDVSIAGSIADTTGNTLTTGTTTVSGTDGVAPTFASVSRVDSTTIQVTLADGVDVNESSIAASDFSLSNGSISSISVAESGTDATVTITLAAAVDTDSLDVSIAGSVADGDGNALTSGTKTVSGMDGVGPSLASVSRVDDTTISLNVTDGVDVDESSIAAGDFSLSNGSVGSVAVSEFGTNATVTITLAAAIPDNETDVTISGSIADTTGNTLTTGTATVSGMDGVAPTVSNLSVSNPADLNVSIAFDTDEQLANVTVTVSGAESATLSRENLTETADGNGYEYDVTYSGRANGTYTVTVTDAVDTKGNNATHVSNATSATDATAPTADAGDDTTANPGNDRIADANTSVAFDGTNSTDNVDIVSYDWSFGDGASATGATVNHTYTTPGNYIVTLTVTDTVGNTDTDSLVVTVRDTTPPNASAGGNVTVIVNTNATFDGTNSTDDVGVTSYDWSFGDGASASGATVNHTYSKTGTYTATLTVTDAAGHTDTDSVTVTVAPALNDRQDTDGDGIPDFLDQAPNDPEDLDGVEDSDGVPETDPDGDGIPDAVEEPAGDGTTDTDGDGTIDALDTDSDGDGILDSAEAGTDPTDPVDTDDDGDADFRDTDSDGDGIPDATEESNPKGTTDTDGDGTPDYRDTDSDGDGIPDEYEGSGDADSDGTANYRDTDSDGDGIPDSVEGTSDRDGDGVGNYRDTDSDGDGKSDAVEGTGDEDGDGTPDYLDPVDDDAQVRANPSASSHLVEVGTQVTLSGVDSVIRASGTPTYQWTLADGTTATGENITKTYTKPGTYQIRLNVTAGGYSGAANVTVEVRDTTPPATNLSVPTTVTEGQTFTADASTTTDDLGISSYSWQFGDGTTASGSGLSAPTHSYDDPGTYTVTVSVTDDAGNVARNRTTIRVLGPEATVSSSSVDYGAIANGSTALASVTIRNDGTAPLDLTGASLSGTDASAFALSGATARQLPVIQPGETVTVTVAFEPTSTGTKTATLTLSTNDTDSSTVSVSLSGDSKTSSLAANTSLAYGDVSVDGAETKTVRIDNTGGTTVTITSSSISGDAAGEYRIVSGVGSGAGSGGGSGGSGGGSGGSGGGSGSTTIPAGESRTVTVAFEPTTVGNHTANLVLETGSGSGTNLSVSLDGTGAGPDIVFPDGTVNFTEIGKGRTVTERVRIRNDGSRPLDVSDVSITGTDAGQFTVEDAAPTLAPGETARVNVTFAPTRAGTFDATLAVASDDPNEPTATAALNGSAVAATVSVDQRNYDFGNVTVGQTVTMNLTVRNLVSSKTNLTVRQTRLTGAEPQFFEVVSGGAPFTLAPGESKRIEVAFTPTTAGTKQAQLQILSDAANAPQIDVWLSNSRTWIFVQEVAENTGGNETVNVDANNVGANTNISVNVSKPSTRRNEVGVEALNMTVQPGGYFEMNVSHADGPPTANSAEFNESGTETVQYVRLAHTVSNDAYGNTTLRYRVNRSALPAGTNPAEVQIRRYSNGTWNTLTATLVRETPRFYIYEVETPGFSQFAVTAPSASESGGDAGQKAEFETVGVTISDETPDAGDSIAVAARIQNVGDGSGDHVVTLFVDGQATASKRIVLNPDTAKNVTFTHTFTDGGTYQVRVTDSRSFDVVVGSASSGGSGDTDSTDTPSTPTDTPPTSTGTPSTPTDTPPTSTDTPSTPTDTPSTPTDTPSTPTDTPPTSTDTPATPTDTPATPTDTPSTPTDTPTETSETASDESPTETDTPTPTPSPTSTDSATAGPGGEQSLEIAGIRVNRTAIGASESVEITVMVSNPATGSDADSLTETITVRVNGEAVASKTVTVPPDESREVTFVQTFRDTGEFTISADTDGPGATTPDGDGTAVEQVTVGGQSDDSCELFGIDFGHVFGLCWYWVAFVLLGLAAAVITVVRFRRDEGQEDH
jgi:PGF-pre-PGF domain-containing protein